MSGYLNSAGVIHSVKPDLEQARNGSASPAAWLALARKTPVEVIFLKGSKRCCSDFDFLP